MAKPRFFPNCPKLSKSDGFAATNSHWANSNRCRVISKLRMIYFVTVVVP